MNQALEVLAKLGRNESVSLETLPAHIAVMVEANDMAALKTELNITSEIVCAVLPAEDDPEESEEQQNDNSETQESSACA